MKQKLFNWGALVSGGLAVALLCFIVATIHWFIILTWQSSYTTKSGYVQTWIGNGIIRLEIATGKGTAPWVDPPPSTGLSVQLVRAHFFPSMVYGTEQEFAGIALSRIPSSSRGDDSYTLIEAPLYFVFFITLIWPAVWLVCIYRAERLAQRRREHLCVTCGYDLRGSPLAGQCPECGKAYGDSQERAAGPSKPSSRSRNISS